MSSKKHIRHRLLLDEGVHLPNSYPILNNLHDLVHVSKLSLQGLKDEKIFEYAHRNSRMIVVFNIKDFKKFLKPGKPSIIALSTNMTNKQVDLKLCKLLRSLTSKEALGLLFSITNSGIKRTTSI